LVAKRPLVDSEGIPDGYFLVSRVIGVRQHEEDDELDYQVEWQGYTEYDFIFILLYFIL